MLAHQVAQLGDIAHLGGLRGALASRQALVIDRADHLEATATTGQ